MTSRPRLAAIAALLFAGGTILLAQTAPAPQPPTFRAEVEYVEVDALVTDAEGRFVRDLTADDFEVREDGRPQKIVNFSFVEIPVERVPAAFGLDAPPEPESVSNAEPFSGRVYVMVLDDLHTDASRTSRVKLAARQFIEQNLGANDLMAIVHTGRSSSAQEFTGNRRRLLESVDAFVGRKLPSATMTRNDAYAAPLQPVQLPDSQSMDPYDAERADNARIALETLQRVSAWFGNVRGRRKTLILISEGIDYDITDVIRGRLDRISPALQVQDDLRRAVEITARSNVSIYTVDPRGLTAIIDSTIDTVGFAGHDTLRNRSPDDTGAEPPPNRLIADIGMRSLRQELIVSQDNLRMLAEETNGFAVVNENDFAGAFDRIVRDNSAYYVLAYYPPSNRRDGRLHRIEVSVKRPGLTVRARRGYLSPRGDRPEPRRPAGVSAELIESLNSPLPVNGLRMRTFAAPFRGQAPNASVLLGIELVGQDLSLADRGLIEISYVVVDSQGRTQAEKHDRMTPIVRPENRTRIQDTGLRLLNRVELAPGRYQVRAAARDHGGGLSGSVIYDLDVPDFDEVPVGISGVALASMSGSAFVTLRGDDGLQGILPGPPVAIREFPQNDEIALFAEVYDNSSSSPHRVDIRTTIRGADGTIHFSAADQRDSSELAGGRGAYGHTIRTPLTSLPPGEYLVTVEARSLAGNHQPARRDIRFRVAPAV